MSRILTLLTVFVCASAFAQPDSITVPWPSADQPKLKLTFSKFQQSAISNGQGIYTTDVVVQNLSDSTMPRSLFTVYISDKNNVRIGLAKLQLPQISPYQSQKGQINFSAAGVPAGITLLAGKTIPLRVISTPPGANLKVDGEDSGVSPKVVDFTIGEHILEFSREGYATGSTVLDVTSDQLPGGSITFELGGLSQDTVELRDGTVLQGDVLSMSMTEVLIGVNGNVQKYQRNQIKKVMLVEREAPAAEKKPSTK
jgi:hypothetical protein